MDRRYIYLVFSRTGTWLSRILSLFTECKYIHSSISFDNSFTKMYSFGRRNPNNPFFAGFAEENLFEGVYKKFSNSECIIYRLEVTEEQYCALEEEINRFLIDKEIYKYNFLGLFGILLNRPLDRSNYYFCSQFVSEVLINSKIYSSSKCPALIRTEDLMTIEEKDIIYEGVMNQCFVYDEAYNLN